MRIKSVREFSAREEREAITHATDAYQDRVISSVQRSGFAIDWSAILAAVEAAHPAHIEAFIRDLVARQLRSDHFLDTDAALIINGDLIAQYAQQRHEREIASHVQPPTITPAIEFAEAPLFSPEAAVAYWQRILGLSDEDAAKIIASVRTLQQSSFGMGAQVTEAMMQRVISLIGDTLRKGTGVPDFLKQAREVLPGASDAILETEYRTRLTTAYGGARVEQIQRRSSSFPFAQFMIVKDGRNTWNICLPMGTSGPGGRGYICASDDPLVKLWQPPNHYRCRSDWSPISFLEAQRMGILAQDGVTRIAIVGGNPDRPFGDPPKFVQGPHGQLVEVKPAEGFGG